jgi:hypothetical protein
LHELEPRGEPRRSRLSAEEVDVEIDDLRRLEAVAGELIHGVPQERASECRATLYENRRRPRTGGFGTGARAAYTHHEWVACPRRLGRRRRVHQP